jgi:hypothetical protein
MTASKRMVAAQAYARGPAKEIGPGCRNVVISHAAVGYGDSVDANEYRHNGGGHDLIA